jgi:hypothetical protein
MPYDRPSWKDIDRSKDNPGGRRNRRDGGEKHEIKEHSTRYNRYKEDLDRMFDQGLAGELLKKIGKEAEKDKKPIEPERPQPKPKAKAAVVTRPGNGRIPKNTAASTNRLKLIRAVIDAEGAEALVAALNELVTQFGLPDDWEVLGRALEHRDEKIMLDAVTKMKNLLPSSVKIPRRFTLRERLRTISQTASDETLRQVAAELGDRL